MAKKKGRPGTPREGFVTPKSRRTSLGVVPALPERDLDPEMEDIVAEYLPLLKGTRAHRLMKLKLIQLTAPGPGQMSGTAAYHSLNPSIKRSSCSSTACRYFREIESEIGEEGRHALAGVHIKRIDRILADASGAMFTRQFVDRNGNVVTAPALVDHALRMRSAELMMKVLGVGKEKESGQALTVNVISYAPLVGPGSLKDDPWPGGGRGSLPVATIVSPPALPSPTKTIVYDPASVSTGNRHD